MELNDFSYFLPEELIAQHPRPRRDISRMMVVNRGENSIRHSRFHDLPGFLQKGDVLVLNDSRVIPAKIYGKKSTGAIIEALLLNRRRENPDAQVWEVMARPAKRIAENEEIDLGHGCRAKVLSRLSDKKWLMSFSADGGFQAYLERFGRAPLPPYIKRRKTADPDQAADRERYQTVYAKTDGSIAAPTAGLHFSRDTLNALNDSGVETVFVTLHVGIGTFMPILTEKVEDHVMEEELYEIGTEAAGKINRARRVIAVGTTATRALESATDDQGLVRPQSGRTKLFIYPGYEFKRVDAMVTNFHLPRSSLFLLVSAFAGTDLVRQAYAGAVKEGYLFYSYGDCMLIL